MNLGGLLKLSAVPGVGGGRLRALVSHFGSPEAVFDAGLRELVKVPGIDKKTALRIVHFDDGERFVSEQLKRMRKSGGRIVTFWDEEYPEQLKRIYDPPPFFFIRGFLNAADKYSLAIVGTRSPTSYGKTAAEKFTEELGTLGLTIVSGLARGIDTIAHHAALRIGARTIAVIGSGIDVIYPPENKHLAERIAESGAVISEFEMGAQPDAEHFPRRNRIISGLSLGTLVIETDTIGGAMITARCSLDQNREVFAVPGPIHEKRSAGCNALIKRGEAKLVQETGDIIAELAPRLRPLLKSTSFSDRRPPAEISLFEKKVYDVLDEEPMHIDLIAQGAGITTSDALVQLLSLEFKGLVRQLPGKAFRRT